MLGMLRGVLQTEGREGRTERRRETTEETHSKSEAARRGRREESDVRRTDGEELEQREHTLPEEVSEETEAPLKTRRLFKRRKERLLQMGPTSLVHFREAVLTAANRKRGLLR